MYIIIYKLIKERPQILILQMVKEKKAMFFFCSNAVIKSSILKFPKKNLQSRIVIGIRMSRRNVLVQHVFALVLFAAELAAILDVDATLSLA